MVVVIDFICSPHSFLVNAAQPPLSISDATLLSYLITFVSRFAVRGHNARNHRIQPLDKGVEGIPIEERRIVGPHIIER